MLKWHSKNAIKKHCFRGINMENFKGIWIPTQLLNLDISWTKRILIAEINQLSMEDKGCVASNNHFSKKLKLTKQAISKALNEMKKDGIITIDNAQTKRNFGRKITINFGKSAINFGKSAINFSVQSKENKQENIQYIDFQSKFSFINEDDFNRLITHLESKYEKLTKVRITNNLKKLKNNPELFSLAVEKMIELDFNGLFVPSTKQQKKKQSLPKEMKDYELVI